MKRQNCWEFKNCGRGPNGKNDCPAARESDLNGVHGGVNGGRACWVSAGTRSGSATTGTFAKKLKECLRCDFYMLVEMEEQSSEVGFSASRLGMLKTLNRIEISLDSSVSSGKGSINAKLRNEFIEEINKMMSIENGMSADQKTDKKGKIE
jgi:hypothetical protein